jgi:hypothetical protein
MPQRSFNLSILLFSIICLSNHQPHPY